MNLENVHFVGLYCIIISQCTAQKNIKIISVFESPGVFNKVW